MKGLGIYGLCAVLMVGCGPSMVVDEPLAPSSAPDGGASVVELERADELTQQLLQIRLDEIPDDVDADEALSALLEYKTRLGQQAEGAWEKLGEQPEYRQLSLVRIAQGYLNFSCVIADSPIPDRLTDEERNRYRGILADAALKVMDNADEALAEAITVDAGNYEGIAPGDLRARLASSSEQVADACEATRTAWMPTDPIDGRQMLELACASREGGCDLSREVPTDEGDHAVGGTIAE